MKIFFKNTHKLITNLIAGSPRPSFISNRLFYNTRVSGFTTKDNDGMGKKSEDEEIVEQEEEVKNMKDFLNTLGSAADQEATIVDDDASGTKEKAEQYSLIYYPTRILPYSRLQVTNNRNDTFFSLVMKYGKPVQIDDDTIVIENITLFSEKDDPNLKSASKLKYGTECKITYENKDRLLIEGIDKVYKIDKPMKTTKHRLFNPKEAQVVESVYINTKEYLQKTLELFDRIVLNHGYITQTLDIEEDSFIDPDLSFPFKLSDIKTFVNTKGTDPSAEAFYELNRFTYYFIAKMDYFSNLVYNNNAEISKYLSLKDINMKLERISEHFEAVQKLLMLKYENYNFLKNFKLNTEHPFDITNELDIHRILKYKEVIENKYDDAGEKLKNEYIKKISSLQYMPEEVKTMVEREVNKLSSGIGIDVERNKILEYLNHVLALPWDNYDNAVWDINHAQKVLDDNLYGLKETKERIYEFIAKNLRKNNKKGCVILLTGGPGTGKTRIAKLIGEALQRKTGFISLGGQRDGRSILGFKRTYVGSTPGVFTKEMQKLGVKNPVIVIDEIDKVGASDFYSNVYYSLLQLLNIEENHRFTDHYLEIPFDYSNVIFILTSNKMNIFPPLLDRMEVIKVDPYSSYEKFLILKNYSKKQILNEYGINELEITDKALFKLITDYCNREAGVRKAKQLLESVVRKVVSKLELNDVEGKTKEIQINSENIEKIITEPKDEDIVLKNIIGNVHKKPGYVIGLYVSKTDQSNSWGNASLFSLEVRNPKKFKEDAEGSSKIAEDKNETDDVTTISHTDVKIVNKTKKSKIKMDDFKVKVTGNMGDDSTQSLSIAINVAINILNEVDPTKQDFFYKNSLHYNAPEIYLSKSGPSAGVVNFLCAMSLALNKPVIENLALTGEVALDGTVLNIGGVREKSNGARMIGVKTLVIPFGNRHEFNNLPDNAKDAFDNVYFVQNCYQVYKIGFGLDTSDIPSYRGNSNQRIEVEEQRIDTNLINNLFNN
jgi:endopeptidase La